MRRNWDHEADDESGRTRPFRLPRQERRELTAGRRVDQRRRILVDASRAKQLSDGATERHRLVIHLRRHKYQDILVVPASADVPGTFGGPRLTFNADGEVDALATRAASVAACGRSAVHAPIDTPWNTREVTIIDPAGHVLVFTSRREHPDHAVEASWRAMFEHGRLGGPK